MSKFNPICLFCNNEINNKYSKYNTKTIYRCLDKICHKEYEPDYYFENRVFEFICYYHNVEQFNLDRKNLIIYFNEQKFYFNDINGKIEFELETKIENFNKDIFIDNVNSILETYYLFK